MNSKRRLGSALLGALFCIAGVTAPALAAEDVAGMSPAELRTLFHQPGFSVPDGLGDYNEDYHAGSRQSAAGQSAESSTIAVSRADRGAICAALADALNYLRGRDFSARRVAYGNDSDIVRWYDNNCVNANRAEPVAASDRVIDHATLKALRRLVIENPPKRLDDY